ncbi:TetR/AcrR family transcriptional regulator [Paenibacillus sp. IB182496]|uniref:TetR/AcrR family transcriptional regulator n=1 Tax=Paenibacillus sabuli TaxID=2772509 RepID=A0A927GRL0_9BACL|nr:TetR/AcrR family transcriptional regulator [Paenibacillus sabuli]MBD2845371.1 TetR/AcrR family transcriptional regulator [Paenibacillus sabuli]
MPKKFDLQTRETVRAQLMQAGREQFARYGLQKTNVAELAKASAIAAGTFYAFFPSKEALYFELLEEEERRIRKQLYRLAEASPPTAASFRQFFRDAFRLLRESPFIRQTLDAAQLAALVRKLPAERLARNAEQDNIALLPLLGRWQDAGVLRPAPGELIVSAMRALLLLALHEVEIGELQYEATMQLLIDSVSDGLLRNEGARTP